MKGCINEVMTRWCIDEKNVKSKLCILLIKHDAHQAIVSKWAEKVRWQHCHCWSELCHPDKLGLSPKRASLFILVGPNYWPIRGRHSNYWPIRGHHYWSSLDPRFGLRSNTSYELCLEQLTQPSLHQSLSSSRHNISILSQNYTWRR